jgi:hypothetical protein
LHSLHSLHTWGTHLLRHVGHRGVAVAHLLVVRMSVPAHSSVPKSSLLHPHPS